MTNSPSGNTTNRVVQPPSVTNVDNNNNNNNNNSITFRSPTDAMSKHTCQHDKKRGVPCNKELKERQERQFGVCLAHIRAWKEKKRREEFKKNPRMKASTENTAKRREVIKRARMNLRIDQHCRLRSASVRLQEEMLSEEIKEIQTLESTEEEIKQINETQSFLEQWNDEQEKKDQELSQMTAERVEEEPEEQEEGDQDDDDTMKQ